MHADNSIELRHYFLSLIEAQQLHTIPTEVRSAQHYHHVMAKGCSSIVFLPDVLIVNTRLPG
jgi:hypothetical protein